MKTVGADLNDKNALSIFTCQFALKINKSFHFFKFDEIGLFRPYHNPKTDHLND